MNRRAKYICESIGHKNFTLGVLWVPQPVHVHLGHRVQCCSILGGHVTLTRTKPLAVDGLLLIEPSGRQLADRLLHCLNGEAVVVVGQGGVQNGHIWVTELRLQRRRISRVEWLSGCHIRRNKRPLLNLRAKLHTKKPEKRRPVTSRRNPGNNLIGWKVCNNSFYCFAQFKALREKRIKIWRLGNR